MDGKNQRRNHLISTVVVMAVTPRLQELANLNNRMNILLHMYVRTYRRVRRATPEDVEVG